MAYQMPEGNHHAGGKHPLQGKKGCQRHDRHGGQQAGELSRPCTQNPAVSVPAFRSLRLQILSVMLFQDTGQRPVGTNQAEASEIVSYFPHIGLSALHLPFHAFLQRAGRHPAHAPGDESQQHHQRQHGRLYHDAYHGCSAKAHHIFHHGEHISEIDGFKEVHVVVQLVDVFRAACRLEFGHAAVHDAGKDVLLQPVSGVRQQPCLHMAIGQLQGNRDRHEEDACQERRPQFCSAPARAVHQRAHDQGEQAPAGLGQ